MYYTERVRCEIPRTGQYFNFFGGNNMGTLILICLFVVTVLISAVIGLIRGLNKSVVRIMILAVAAALTFLVAGPITKLIAGSITVEGLTLGELLLKSLQGEGFLGTILESTPVLREVIQVLPAFAISIVVFPLVFLLLRFISWIVFLFVQKPLRKLIFKDPCSKEEEAAKPTRVRVGKRFAGMGVGIVSGILVFGMLFTPLIGVFSILPSSDAVSGAMQILVSTNAMPEADADDIQELYAVTDCGLVKFYRFVGAAATGRAYINSVSTIRAEGQAIRLANEIRAFMAILQSLGENSALLNAENPAALYATLSDKALVDSLMQNVFQSRLMAAVIPELMASAMEGVAESMHVPADKDAVYDNMMDTIAMAVQDTNVDFEAIHAYEQAHNVAATFARFRSAARTGGDGLMTEEEYEAQIQQLAELAAAISAIINRSLAGDSAAFADSVADHIVNDVKNQASENGQGALEGYDAAALQNTLSGMDASDIDAGDGDASKLLEQLTDKEQFETDMATVETIKAAISGSIREALSDESKSAETASALASVISDLSGAIASATGSDGETDITKMDFNKIASAITTLQNSPLKEAGSSILDIVISGDLGSNSMIGGLMSAVKEGYDNGEDVGGTIGTAGALISLGAAMGTEGEEGQQAMVDSITDLINNLNEYTITLLPEILNAEALGAMGIPSKFMEATYTLIETLLRELMKLKGEADYQNEANAVLSLYNLATAGVDKFTPDDIGDLAGYAMASDAIYNTLLSVPSNPFGIELGADATAELAGTIESEFAQSGKTDKERDIYLAIAALLGVDGNVNLG